VWLVLDVGALMDEQHARESIELGILRSLFWAGGSHVEYRKGRIPRADYLSARTPDIGTTPRISIQFVGGGSRAPHKGVGELPPACVPAAYIQAVSQATGQYLDRLPSTPRTVFSYLEEE
jgi:CO/xanthine dehydrogenase Mo-binding subunit